MAWLNNLAEAHQRKGGCSRAEAHQRKGGCSRAEAAKLRRRIVLACETKFLNIKN